MKTGSEASGAELIGRNVRLMMECRQTDAEELAKYLAVSPSTFYRRLKKPAMWTVDNLSRMAQYWGVSLPELMGEIRLIAAETDVVMDAAMIDGMIRHRAAMMKKEVIPK